MWVLQCEQDGTLSAGVKRYGMPLEMCRNWGAGTELFGGVQR